MCLAVPGQILSIAGDEPLLKTAKVSFSGAVKDVSLACVPEASVGDYVIVHVGLALAVVDGVAARQTLEELQQLERID